MDSTHRVPVLKSITLQTPGAASVLQENPLLVLERLTRRALDINFDLRTRLLLCEKKLLLLKISPSIVMKKTEPNRDLTRGFLCQFMAPYFKDEKGRGFRNIESTDLMISQCLNNSNSMNDFDKVVFAVKQCLVEETLRGEDCEGLNELRFGEVKSALFASKKMTITMLLGGDVNRGMDWTKVVEYLPNTGISPIECQRIWTIVLKPQIVIKRWTKHHQHLLENLAVRYRFQCWNEVAREIGGGLTGFLAFTRFVTTCGRHLTTSGAWSKDEDYHLLQVVKACTIGREVLWRKAMYYVEDRSVNQCITRWYKINPVIKRGRFSPNEDALLLRSLTKFGPNFAKIASLFGNRSTTQLKDRSVTLKSSANANTNSGEWSTEEDELLILLVKKHGKSKWQLISREMPSRNRVQIRQRYSVLEKKLESNPVLDLESLERRKRYSGNCTRLESTNNQNIDSFIKNRMAGGDVFVKTLRPGRKYI